MTQKNNDGKQQIVLATKVFSQVFAILLMCYKIEEFILTGVLIARFC